MTGDVRRAGGFFLVGALSLLAPALEGRLGPTLAAAGTVLSFGFVAAIALATGNGRRLERFASDDRGERRFYGLSGFALAAAGLGLFAVVTDLPPVAYVVAIFVLTSGNLAQSLLPVRYLAPVVSTSTFVTFGTAGGVGAALLTMALDGTALSLSLVVFVVTSGALLAALVRSALFVRDDALVVVSVGLLVWLLLWLETDPSLERVGVGVTMAAVLGLAAYSIGTASVTGTLTGVLLALFAVVLGGYGWFVLLVTFFGLGSLASKFRYEEKRQRGIAEENEGARKGANVLANSAVALAAIVGFAASEQVGIPQDVFRFAFVGAVGAALADTLSSELGGLFENPRLITTLEPVPPGTDGAVTWQGVLAGLLGAGVIAGLATPFFAFSPLAVGLVLVAGFLGTIVDSLLGATLEGEALDNQSVNLFATLAAALLAGGAALVVR